MNEGASVSVTLTSASYSTSHIHSERVRDEERVENSKTAPFPVSCFMLMNMLVPDIMCESSDPSMSGLSAVVVLKAEVVNVISLSWSVLQGTSLHPHASNSFPG